MRLGTVIAVSAVTLIVFASTLAGDAKYEVLDKQKVYYGDCTSFENPATIVKNEVFPHIREYRLIEERKLDENDPEYWVLLLKANEVFRKALKQVAASSEYDLVAERGAVRAAAAETAVPDITHLMVAEVKRSPEDR